LQEIKTRAMNKLVDSQVVGANKRDNKVSFEKCDIFDGK
jgi:hypothetical protein